MPELRQFPTFPSQPSRLDVPLHELLQQPPHSPSSCLPALPEAKTLPSAEFPQYPELFHDLDEQDIAAHDPVVRTGNRHCPPPRILKTIHACWFPYSTPRLSPT